MDQHYGGFSKGNPYRGGREDRSDKPRGSHGKFRPRVGELEENMTIKELVKLPFGQALETLRNVYKNSCQDTRMPYFNGRGGGRGGGGRGGGPPR